MHTLEFEISKSHQHGRLCVDKQEQRLFTRSPWRPYHSKEYECHMNTTVYRVHTTAAPDVSKRILATGSVARELYQGV